MSASPFHVRFCRGAAVALALGTAISLTALSGGMVPVLADPVTRTTAATTPVTTAPVTTATSHTNTVETTEKTTTASVATTTTPSSTSTTTTTNLMSSSTTSTTTTSLTSSFVSTTATTSVRQTPSDTTTGSASVSSTRSSATQVILTATPQVLIAAPENIKAAQEAPPVEQNPPPAPQSEIAGLLSAVTIPANQNTQNRGAWDGIVRQWNPDWVGYDTYHRPVIFNPFPQVLQIVYRIAGTVRILLIQPLAKVVAEILDPGQQGFTVIGRTGSGDPTYVAQGSVGGGGSDPGAGLPPPPPPPPPAESNNVCVVVNYTQEHYKPFVVRKVVDVGDDPQYGGHKVLLDGVTPAWGDWTTPSADCSSQFVVHKTQALPGLEEPREAPLPGGYPMQLADYSPPPGFGVVPVVVALFIAALILGAILVGIALARQNRLRGRSGFPSHAAYGRGATTAAGVVGVPPARVLNVDVVDQSRAVLPKSAVLVPGAVHVYEVRIDIGAPSDVRPVDSTSPHPTDQLQPTPVGGAWFDVLIVSGDVGVAAQLHRIFLPSSGPSWVCGCQGPEHICSPRDRQPHLYVPISTPSQTGPASLRCIAYSRNNVVQSTRLDVMVGAGKPGGDNIAGVVDFSLAGDVGDAAVLPPRDLSVLTNESRSGTHTIAINDGHRSIAVYISDVQATEVLSACRRKLTQIVLNKRGTGSNFDRDNGKPTDAFITDLKGLALLGSELYGAVVPDRDDRAYLRAQLNQRSRIQVARVTRTAFPWPLIYDIPREVTVEWEPCRLLSEWESAAEQLAQYPDGCPYQAEHHANVLCPYGFWGLRHLIEEPPSVGRGVLRDKIRVYPPAKAALVRTLALNAELTKKHFSELQGCLCPPFELVACDSRALLQSAFADPTLPLVYFYCHGGRARLAETELEIPVLQIGEKDQIAPGDFAAWDEAGDWGVAHWRDTAPLVFINGCETVKLMPDDILSFVEALAGMHAAGVIGTEIPIDQTIAGEVALRFYRQFCGDARASVGMALHRTRIDLLRKGNISGLVYTPYCSMDLALEFARIPDDSMSQRTATAPPVTMPSDTGFARGGTAHQ